MEIVNTLPLHAKAFIGAMVVFGLYFHLFAFNAKAAAHGPAIFTTLGIFATFLGIALGLLRFDVGDVQRSVPALLDGLKTAFWASVFGVGIALTFKIRHALWGIPARFQSGQVYGASIDDLVAQLTAVRQALVGGGKANLLSAIERGRAESNDRLDAIKRAQDESLRTLADNNSKALIGALEAVMRDFNAKINEQFGDNFKELNRAVEKILLWQERYREQMAEMIEQQKQSAASMGKASQSYAELVDNSARFSAVGERLGKVIESLDAQRGQIERSVAALAKLLATLSDSLPQVERKVAEVAAQMAEAVRASSEASAQAVRQASTALQGSSSEMQRTMLTLVQATNQDFNKHILDIADKTREQVALLDFALEKELTTALDTMARQLTALSQQFVEDYRPLTERLRQLLTLSKGL